MRKKVAQFKQETGTKKGINTIMLSTRGIQGKDALGVVTKSLTQECLFNQTIKCSQNVAFFFPFWLLSKLTATPLIPARIL